MTNYFKGIVRQARPGAASLQWQNVQPHASNDLRYSAITEISTMLDTSRLHIAIPLKGNEPYWVDGQYYEAQPGEYFIFNPQQEVSVEGKFEEKVTGLCLYLDQTLLSEVAHTKYTDLTALLDAPNRSYSLSIEFPVRSYRLNENTFGNGLQRLRNYILQPETEHLIDWDVFYYELANQLLDTRDQIQYQLSAISCVKTLTRQEIFRRLSIAHCYILDNFAEPISLDKLAQLSCFSKYYIIRLYRQIYGLTPYQHLLQLRIKKAKVLLRQDYSPSEVALALSFSDRRAFSKIFKKMMRMTPTAYQQSGEKPEP